MNFYKNVEIARKYNVSVDTVANWITGSLERKNELELFIKNKRAFILKTASNQAILQHLSDRSKKFKNKKYLKKIYPSPELFETYNDEQIMDLISILESHRELDLKFFYFKNGSTYWDDLYNRSLMHNGFSIPRNTEEILNISKEILLNIMNKFEKVDVIDIGVGNGKHITNLLKLLQSNKILNKYIGLDYSKDMLGIAQSNIRRSLPGFTNDQYFVHDISNHSINKFLFRNNDESIGKLVFFIGSTIENIRDYLTVLRLLKNSLNKDDILVLGNTLKNENSLLLLNFNHNTRVTHENQDGYYQVVEKLGIKEDFYEVQKFYDKNTDTRLVKIKLKYDLDIIFKTNTIDRVIKLSSTDLITIFRHKHHSLQEINYMLASEGFRVLHSITSSDYGNLITICSSEFDY